MGFVNDKSEKPWKTIDRERGITLITVKNNSPELGTNTFKLDIQGKQVGFYGIRWTNLVKHLKKDNITWKIYGVCWTGKERWGSDGVGDDVLQIIEEAMQTYGFLHSTDLVNTTTVEFL